MKKFDTIWHPTFDYRSQPNYYTVHLGFSKVLGKTNLATYLRVHFKKKDQGRTHQMILMQYFFFLILFIKAYVVGTHLNCIDKSM